MTTEPLQQNIDDFEAFYDKQFEEIFENIERERREESENAVDYKEFEKYNNTAGVVVSEIASLFLYNVKSNHFFLFYSELMTMLVSLQT